MRNLNFSKPRDAKVPLTEEQLRAFFKKHDTNGDGQLDRGELRKSFKDLDAFFPSWRAHWALHHADADGNGRVDEKEMGDLVKYAASFGYTVK
ncbi:probable calcium-binding protein CML28 [Malania oleifera]|uniref:probable calcium-binding protein CML28 n=1 Tax=Malania oleifera TaxID=397392 RepID=UPI0025AE9FDB|nr:probable calcium-binding protein CML28 [Malania oleifera]